MKHLLLGLALIITLQSFAQDNFRGMNWGDTPTQLKKINPTFKIEKYSQLIVQLQ